MNKKVGLFFGSFNPIHLGHLIIADFIAQNSSLNQVMFVVSPQNPFKQKKSLANDRDRLHLVHLSIEDNPRLHVSDIEFSLPKPSYTIDTLVYLKEKHPHTEFSLIMGGDNLQNLHTWKNGELIKNKYEILVYSRPNYDISQLEIPKNIHILNAPKLDLSSTYIRLQIQNKKSIKYLVHPRVEDYIEKTGLYC